MKFSRQTTLRSQATVTGVGVHSGLPVNLTIGPAPIDAGFVFVRTGLDDVDREVPAIAESVIATDFATVLGDNEGPLVSTAEHVLAALRGMSVDNATIEVDGPEVPIMDGSAAAFVAAIDQAGIVTQSAARRFIQVLKPVQVAIGDSFGELRPHANGFRAEVEIDFANPVIGRQNFSLDLSPESFRAYRSVRGGHKLNHAVLTALMADRSAWRVVEAEPARRPRGHAEAGAGMAGGMVAPAYGPDVS
jgi:UDP-3-O-[3-hydroxymyristoyl] N-acetylglucosamine deacetylase